MPPCGFGLLPVRSPLLRESFLFLEVLRCFSSPGAPRVAPVPGHHAGRVAPFGDPWITGCQRLPRAFRCVAASFIGRKRQGIHRAPINADLSSAPSIPRPAVVPRPARAPGAVRPVGSSPSPDPPRRVRSRSVAFDVVDLVLVLQCGVGQHVRIANDAGCPRPRSLVDSARSVVKVQTDALARVAGGAAGVRTPDLRRAKAALSRLSYGPALATTNRNERWARLDSNQGPRPYQGRALTA